MVSQFLIDLERGKIEEKKIFDFLKKSYPKIIWYEGYKKEYDILVNNNYGIEVKFDERSKKTGNFFIEAYFNNNESGINSTLAKLWIISNGEKYFFITTKKLKKFIKDKNLKLLSVILHGNKMNFYLIVISQIQHHGKYIQIA